MIWIKKLFDSSKLRCVNLVFKVGVFVRFIQSRWRLLFYFGNVADVSPLFCSKSLKFFFKVADVCFSLLFVKVTDVCSCILSKWLMFLFGFSQTRWLLFFSKSAFFCSSFYSKSLTFVLLFWQGRWRLFFYFRFRR